MDPQTFSPSENTQNGFTLLEVVIAITILAFISVFTANSIQTALRSKTKIEMQIDRSTLIRDALRVIGDDIRKSFRYEDIHVALFNIAQKERKKRYEEKSKQTKPKEKPKPGEAEPPKDPNEPGTEPQTETSPAGTNPQQPVKEFPLKEEIKVTRFFGETDRLNFSSLSNRRAYKDAPISNQAEIGYYLEDCKNRLNKKKSSKCLWRRTANIIDKEIEEGGKAMVLVENVTEFSLRYLASSKDSDELKWLDKWDSNEESNDDTGSKFPQAVEITLELHDKEDKRDKPIKMTYIAALRFPEGVNLPKEETVAQPKEIGSENELQN